MQGIHQSDCCSSQCNLKEKNRTSTPRCCLRWCVWDAVPPAALDIMCSPTIVGQVTMTPNHPCPPFHCVAFASPFEVKTEKSTHTALNKPGPILLHPECGLWLHRSRDKPFTRTKARITLNQGTPWWVNSAQLNSRSSNAVKTFSC